MFHRDLVRGGAYSLAYFAHIPYSHLPTFFRLSSNRTTFPSHSKKASSLSLNRTFLTYFALFYKKVSKLFGHVKKKLYLCTQI